MAISSPSGYGDESASQAQAFCPSMAMNPPREQTQAFCPSVATPQIIHQKQRLQLCLLHALNNLFQGESTFTRSELDAIASRLSAGLQPAGSPFLWIFGVHHNLITGNYDANVLMAALQSRKAEAVWYDRRKGIAGLDLSDPDKKLVGIILNHPVVRFAGLWKGRHWVALRKIEGLWYDLDSDLRRPSPFLEGDDEVKRFLEERFSGGSEAFIVFKMDEDNAAKGPSTGLGLTE